MIKIDRIFPGLDNRVGLQRLNGVCRPERISELDVTINPGEISRPIGDRRAHANIDLVFLVPHDIRGSDLDVSDLGWELQNVLPITVSQLDHIQCNTSIQQMFDSL